MELIKNRLRSLRSCITNENLNWLMLTAIEGPDLLPEDAIEEVLNLRRARGMAVPV